MSSDVILYSTVGAVGVAAAGVASYFALKKASSEFNPDTDCVYDLIPISQSDCDCIANAATETYSGSANNPEQCPETKTVKVPCSAEQKTQCKKNCKLSEWSAWSACDCGTKLVHRTRSILQQAESGGTPCDTLVETKDCTSECIQNNPPNAPDCSLRAECTEQNPCSPLRNGSAWECKHRCSAERKNACDPSYQEEVCRVPQGEFGDFTCSVVCDPQKRPTCVKPGCCKSPTGCVVKAEASNGLFQIKTFAKGEWYCEDPCVNQSPLSCPNPATEAACVLGPNGHSLQCVSKCRALPRPATSFSEDLVCQVNANGVAGWAVTSMCANKPLPACADQSRTASLPQCVLTSAALLRQTPTSYTPDDFEWKCISPCGVEPGCAKVPGITPMICAQDPLNGTYQWTGTCIRNLDVEKCGPYTCGANEMAYCTKSRAWTSCVSSACRANPDPNYACPGAGADPLIDYKEVCDPVTSVVVCKPQCKSQPPTGLNCDPKTQYPVCDDKTGFRYECRNYGDTMCSAAKPRPNFRCVPGDNGWNWVDENTYFTNRRQYVDYIQRQAVFAPYRYEAINADNPNGPKITVLCQDIECKAPISPTIGVGCLGSAKVAKALEGALGNPIGNLTLTNPSLAMIDNNLTYIPRDASKRAYYRPNRNDYDVVCPLTAKTCNYNGTFVQASPFNPLELISATKPYSGSIEGSCVCRAGFLGSDCQFSNALTCNSKGTVDATGKCTSCLSGFAGSNCQFELVSKCGTNATAISTTVDEPYQCSCPAGFYGTNSDGKAACLNKDAVFTGSVICTNPCRLPGTVNTAEFSQPYCTVAAVGGGKTCQEVASDVCSSYSNCRFNNGPGWYVFTLGTRPDGLDLLNAGLAKQSLSDFNGKIAVTKTFWSREMAWPTVFRLDADGTLIARDFISEGPDQSAIVPSLSWRRIYGNERRLAVRAVFDGRLNVSFLFPDGSYYKPTTSLQYLVTPGDPAKSFDFWLGGYPY